MNSKWKYLLIGALVFVVAFVVAMPFVASNAMPWGAGNNSCACGSGFNSWGMMPHRTGAWGMMGASGYSFFGGLMMFGMWLLPLSILVLVVLGIVWLVRNLTTKS